MRLVGLLLLLALAYCVAGCGTFDANLHIAYRSDGTVRAAVHIEGTEALSLDVLESGFAEQLRAAGWEIAVTDNGARAVVAGAVERNSPDAMLPALQAVLRPDLPDQPGLFGQWRFRREDEVFLTRTMLVAHLPENGLGGADGLPAIMYLNEEGRRQAADRAARFRLMVSLPGEIMETNADHRTSDQVAWVFTFSELDRGRVLLATSRAVRWDNVALTAIMSIASGVTMLGVLLRTTRGAPQRTPAPSSSVAEEEDAPFPPPLP